MRNGFFFKLALSNIKRNKDIYKPYIFASSLMVLVYYVFRVLNSNPGISGVPHSNVLDLIMTIGVYVAMGFSLIFIFYANSFLMKRRKKELGLYGILGLERRHVAVLMVLETVITGLLSVAAGIIFGLVFAKLAFLILLKLIHFAGDSTLVIEGETIFNTVLFFAAVFLVILIYNLFQVSLSRPIDLLKSENKGEREPKGSVVLTVFGLIFLLAGYIAAQIMDDIGYIFLLAAPTVVCVIIGTYLLFVAGSIAVLKKLKGNKRIYYKPDNFISISGLIYRMKQNAVGLASICILCTMVIITLATTFSLQIGIEDSARKSFTDDVEVSSMPETEYKETMEEAVDKYSAVHHINVDEFYIMRDREFYGYFDEDGILQSAWQGDADGGYHTKVGYIKINLISAEEYERITGEALTLKQDEAVMIFNKEAWSKSLPYTYTDEESKMQLQNIQKGMTLHMLDDGETSLGLRGEKHAVDEKLELKEVRNENKLLEGKYGTRKEIYLVVADEKKAVDCSNEYWDSERYAAVLNYSGTDSGRQLFINDVKAALDATGYGSYFNSFDLVLESYYTAYGGLIFIGVLLSLLFLVAMVIIIYYKQMSEGFEDRDRYHILMQVGIDETDVRRTISKQVKSIFMLPLAVAVIHTAAAFKMIGKLVAMADISGIENYALFGMCTLVVAGIIALIYGIVYKITARAYYRFIH